jgi:hypothetical protein
MSKILPRYAPWFEEQMVANLQEEDVRVGRKRIARPMKAKAIHGVS